MYADPSHKREIPIKARYTEKDAKLIEAVAHWQRTQPATLIHDVSMQIMRELVKNMPEDIKQLYRI